MVADRLTLWRGRLARFALTSGATLIYGVLGVIRNKWLAQNLATAGLGTVAQVLAAQNWLGQAAGLGLGLPLTRAVGAARGAGDAPAERRAVRTAFLMISVSAVAIAVAMLFLAPWISEALLGTPERAGLVRLSALGVVGLAVAGTLLAVFAGYGDVRAPVTLAAGGACTATVLTLLFVPRYGLPGATLAAALLFPAGVVAAMALHGRGVRDALLPRDRNAERPGDASPGDARAGNARAMLAIGGAGLALGLLDQGTLLALRAHYVRVNGIEANGLLQAALALSQQLGTLFYAYLSSYAFGAVSGAAGAAAGQGPGAIADAVRAYTRRHWIPLLFLAALLHALAMVASTPLLRILFSTRFDPARPLMTWTLLGEFGRVGMQVWALGALPLGGVRLLASVLVSYPLSLALAYALFASTGAGALSLPRAYAAAGAASLVTAGVLMSRRGVTLGAREILMTLIGAGALGSLAWWILR